VIIEGLIYPQGIDHTAPIFISRKDKIAMVTLRPMTAEEFSDYKSYFVVDYAHEIMANYGYTTEKSQAIATKDLSDSLPQAIDTPDNVLVCIEETDKGMIGYLWYKFLDEGESVFILDFIMFEDYRGKGYGKATLMTLEEKLSKSGVEQVKLRVAFNNHRAKGLYERIGFHTTGYNMIKILEK
jgi:ribosomal protein S18 acetylase RimI-like enzyme